MCTVLTKEIALNVVKYRQEVQDSGQENALRLTLLDAWTAIIVGRNMCCCEGKLTIFKMVGC
jgi:hypothetical protein